MSGDPLRAANGPATVGRPVVLTTDCGTEMDDQWALTHLALAEGLDLRAVVSTHAPNLAPPAAESAARECRSVLSRLRGGADIPVFAGSSTPLRDARTPWPNAGVARIIAEARRSGDQRLVVLAIGAATDVASALLEEPSLGDRIEIVAMGFQGWEEGGDEWNVKNDVAAWQALLHSGAPITIGDAGACKRHLCLTAAAACDLLGERGPVGSYLAELLAAWLQANAETARAVTGRPDTWPVWDEVVVAHLLGHTTVRYVPRPALRDDLRLVPAAVGAPVGWIQTVDAGALWADLAARCSSAA